MEAEHPVHIERCDDNGFGLVVQLVAPRERVFVALTRPAELGRWWREGVVLEPHVGGHFAEPWVDMSGRSLVTRGEVLAAAPGQLLQWTWADAEWPSDTVVELSLTDTPTGTLLHLDHDGFAELNYALQDDILGAHLIGWRKHLRSLKRYLEETSK